MTELSNPATNAASTSESDYQEALAFLREENARKTEYISIASMGGWMETDLAE